MGKSSILFSFCFLRRVPYADRHLTLVEGFVRPGDPG